MCGDCILLKNGICTACKIQYLPNKAHTADIFYQLNVNVYYCRYTFYGMNNNFDIPVLMLVFNRPDETQRVFDAVKLAKPSKLYVAADGARTHKPDDKILSQQTREIFNQVDWPCEVKTLYREHNLGCGPAVSGAISWFFEQEEMGIILEDDCLPSQDFFGFCKEMLLRYRDDERVMQICGSNFQRGIKRGEASYYFSMFSFIWGWATWRRTWKNYDFELNNIKTDAELNLDFYTTNKGLKRYWKQTFLYSKKKAFNTWDYQWGLTILKHKGLCLVPNVNLVTNIGNTDNSTHGSADDTSWTVNQKLENLGMIVHTNDVFVNKEADSFFYEQALKPRNSITQKIVKTWRYLKWKFS
jgi:hypothetical protein